MRSGAVLPREIKSQAALHGGKQFDVRLVREHLLNQRQVRQVVLDVEDLAALPRPARHSTAGASDFSAKLSSGDSDSG